MLSPEPGELVVFFERSRAFAVEAYRRMARMPTVNIPMKVPELFGAFHTLVTERGPLHGQMVRTIVDMTERSWSRWMRLRFTARRFG